MNSNSVDTKVTIPVSVILVFMYFVETPSWLMTLMAIFLWLSFGFLAVMMLYMHLTIDFLKLVKGPLTDSFWKAYIVRITIGLVLLWIVYSLFGIGLAILHASLLFMSLAFTWRWRNA